MSKSSKDIDYSITCIESSLNNHGCNEIKYWFITSDQDVSGGVFGFCSECFPKTPKFIIEFCDALKRNGDIYLPKVKSYEEAKKFLLLM